MKNVLIKDFFVEIKNTLSRFLSILLIVALGAGFFVGVKAASPSMEYSANEFFTNNNLMDFRVVSDYGFQDDDVAALKELDGIKEVMPSYSTDLLVKSGVKNNVVRVHALPQMDDKKKQPINEVKVVEGRLPEKPGECIVESNQKIPGSYKIGDTVKFASPEDNKDISEIIKEDTFTVVGLVETPQYISFDRGISLVGDGTILYYMMILPEEFTYERYTEVYLTTNKDDETESSFGDEYKKFISSISKKLANLGEIRLEINHDDILAEATLQLDKAKKELENKKKEALTKLNEAEAKLKAAKDEIAAKEKELIEAENKLIAARNELDATYIEINNGEKELITAEKEYNQKIADAEKQIADGRAQYEAGLAEYNKQYASFQAQKKDAEAQITEGKQKLQQLQQIISALEELYSSLLEYSGLIDDEAVDNIVENIKSSITLTPEQSAKLDQVAAEVKSKINSTNSNYNEILNEVEVEINNLKSQYNEGQAEIAAAEKQITDGEKQLANAKAKLDSSKVQLDVAQAQLDSEKQNGAAQLAKARQDIEYGKQQLAQGEIDYETGRAQLEDGKKQLAEGKVTLEKSEKEFKNSKEKFNTEFASAEQQIKDKEKEVESLALGKWYIFTRDDNPGYSSFLQDAERINGIASIFPLFFFIVAALVCLTTMTRMVEEKRTQIGTLKALGYDNSTIIAKYFFYAFIAAIIGSILGIVLGTVFLPRVIFNSYKAMYTLPDFYVDFSWITIIVAIICSLLCTCTVASIVANKELKVNPATLMRPKAPKQGKRILLERITFIWNRMNFSSKVTARNIFRYKARFIMTVLGVAGCTALILAAYGLRDSISVVVPKQYGEIFSYDMLMACKYEGTLQEKSSLLKLVAEDNYIDEEMLTKLSSMDGTSKKNNEPIQVKLFVPENSNKLPDFIKLRKSSNGEKISFDDNSVVITEKLASLLEIGKGDIIKLKDDNYNIELKVTDITENYVFNYVYISPKLYKEVTANEVKYNSIVAKLTDEGKKVEEDIANEWLKREEILVVNFNSDAIESFNDVITSLNSVVFIMILCAAALAFIVVYNLTNINVDERMREIATIKVLGFSDMESANYVYRENVVLSIIGILFGLILGTFLSNFIVTTVEMDIVMFGRKISAISFLYASAFTLIFTLLVNAVMYKKLNSISMVESLKSVE